MGAQINGPRCLTDWLLDHPDVPLILILEDDVCFDAAFRELWAQAVRGLFTIPGEWDCLLMGYFVEAGTGPRCESDS